MPSITDIKCSITGVSIRLPIFAPIIVGTKGNAKGAIMTFRVAPATFIAIKAPASLAILLPASLPPNAFSKDVSGNLAYRSNKVSQYLTVPLSPPGAKPNKGAFIRFLGTSACCSCNCFLVSPKVFGNKLGAALLMLCLAS